MTNLDPIWLVLAGFGGGLTGSVAGIASVVSYPALLAVGLSPLAANVTNAAALVFSSAGSVSGSRPELAGQRDALVRLAPVALAGGAIGATLLLLTPEADFARLVPVLIGVASLTIVAARPPRGDASAGPYRPTLLVRAGVLLASVYSGYFGAAAGVLLLAVLLTSTAQALARTNALKNILLGGANAVAAVAFAVLGPVHWWDVVPLGLGFLMGGRLGPVVVRHVPAWPLRLVIGAAGLGLAVHLGLNAYH